MSDSRKIIQSTSPQSTPFQNLGGTTSVTDEGEQKSWCLILDITWLLPNSFFAVPILPAVIILSLMASPNGRCEAFYSPVSSFT